MSDRALGALGALGWSGAELLPDHVAVLPARVAVVHSASAEVYEVDEAEEPGWRRTTDVRLTNALTITPVAGDWVYLDGDEVVQVIPRTTALMRPAREGHGRQILAANVDVVIVAVSIDRPLNARMLQRLAVMAWDSGAQPVIALTKCDAGENVPAALEQAQALVPGVQVLATSIVSGAGIKELKAILVRGTTGCLLGASGVGKTSILNALGGYDEEVAQVRSDGQGRHTTTTRRLHFIPDGGVLIDIPGLRSLDLDAGANAVLEVFADIKSLKPECRFADCTHSHEPGCAVKDAVASGEMAKDRLEDWSSIQRELAHQQRKVDPLARAREKAKWKAVSKGIRERDHG